MSKEETFFHELKKAGIVLNPTQKEAVTHMGGPLVVFAGPGSGKTTVLTCRASYLMQVANVRPQDILIVTFTKAAAEEMRNRLAGLPGIGELRANSCDMGTFHSIFLRILLRTFGNVPKLLEEGEQRQIVRELLRAEGLNGDEEETGDLLTKIGLCKNNLILPERIKPEKKEYRDFKRRYAQYETWKKKNGRWDYDDILVECHRLLTTRSDIRQEYAGRYRHILVDEFQDTNHVQYEVLKILAGNRQLCIVGDDDQSIYRFRGARVEYLLEFRNLYPTAKKVILATNYRSTDAIIATALAVINRNRKREWKNLAGTGRQGEQPVIQRPADERSEAVGVMEKIRELLQNGERVENIAVLYRTNFQARALVDEMVRNGMSFVMTDSEGSFYQRWQIRDILSYFRLALHPDDLDALAQIINRPKRYLYPDDWMPKLAEGMRGAGSCLQVLMEWPGLESWKRGKLEELSWDLKKIKAMTPREALRFIRKQVGYDEFLGEYARRTGQKKEYVFEPVEILEQAVYPFETLDGFLLHVGKVKEALLQAAKTGYGIRLMTLHKAKGLEFGTVFLIGLVNGMVPHGKSLKEKDLDESMEEERRLFYVGITRAKDRLYLSAPQKYQGKNVEQSPFLAEIGVTAR